MTLLRACGLAVVVIIAGLAPAVAAESEPSRKPASGAVASAHPLATQAGLDILARGGNAFDAAVAVAAALGVVEPYSSGFGGGGFYLLHRASDQMYTMVDGREKAPLSATRDMYLDDNGDPIPGLAKNGVLAAGIPGMPAALVHLSEQYGKLPLALCLEPAIRYAREGFEVDKRFIEGASEKQDLLKTSMAAEVFLHNGEVPPPGHVIKQPLLAQTIERFAADGLEGFYKGETAKLMIAGVNESGGEWSQADFDQYTVIEREPLYGTYRGARIVTASPPSSGGVAMLNALNILEPYNIHDGDSVRRKHLVVEALRRAFRDRAQYLGDPDFVDVPVARLVHKFYAGGQRASIRLDKATDSRDLPGFQPEDEGQHTTHFSVLDIDGNRVGGTQTINFWFGSGYMVPGAGLLLNNEMDDFSIKPGVPNGYGLLGAGANEIQPGKRMLSSMTPTFVENKQGVAILGTPGGSRIISMVLLGVLERIDGANAEQISSEPRYHHQYMPDLLYYESDALSEEEIQALRGFGHRLKETDSKFGNMNTITWDYADNVVISGADPRGVGLAKIRVY